MMTIKKIIFSFVTIYIFSTAFALADHKSGHAHVYKVTMRKVELCTASTPDKDNMTNAATCSNPVVIGSGDVLVDIASVEANSVAASYGDPALFPLGETYTHMRVTIDRKMTVKGFATTGNGDICRTQTAGGGTNYPGGLSGNEKYTHQTVVTEGAGVAITEQDVYMVNDDYTQCNSNAGSVCSGTDANQTMSYNQGSGSSLAQSQHAAASTSNDHLMVYALASPYTVGLVSPTMDIKFGTQSALGAHDIGSFCKITNEEPIVTVTIK